MVNEVITTKMEQSKKLDVSTIKAKEPVQVTMRDSMKVAVGKELAEFNCRKKEELVQGAKAKRNEPKLSQAYGTGAVIAVGALGLLVYYIYQRGSPKGNSNDVKVIPVRSVEDQTQV